MSYLSAHTEASNLLHRGGWPGAGLRACCGVWAEEMDGLPDGDVVSVQSQLPDLPDGQARTYCERIHAEDAEVLATYNAEFYAGQPVLTRRRSGAGQAYYIAARMNQEFLSSLMDHLVREAGVRLILPLRQAGIYAQERSDGQRRFVFIHNGTPEPRTCKLLPGDWVNLESCETTSGSLALAPLASVVVMQGSLPAKT